MGPAHREDRLRVGLPQPHLDRTVRATNPNIQYVVETQQPEMQQPRTLLIAKRPDGDPRGELVGPLAMEPAGVEAAANTR